MSNKQTPVKHKFNDTNHEQAPSTSEMAVIQPKPWRGKEWKERKTIRDDPDTVLYGAKYKSITDDNPYLCGVMILLSLVCAVLLIYYGATGIETEMEWKNKITKESCLIIKKTEGGCSYGNTYEYYALALDKCGNQTLSSHCNEYDYSDLGIIADVGKEHDCYVIDCKDETLLFDYPEESLGGYILMVIAGCVFLFCPCFVWYCIMYCIVLFFASYHG